MSEQTPPQVAPAEPGPEARETKPASLRERFRDPQRWKKSLYDLTLWFLYGILLTAMLSKFSPGYPIWVGTDSIRTGIYWVDRQAFDFHVGDYITFPFQPNQAWLQERYGSKRIFTKQVKAIEGDTLYTDEQGEIRVCYTHNTGPQLRCEVLGVVRKVDSKGRPLTPWLAANQSYTLQAGELWAHGPNPRSLDSRYYGPVNRAIVSGRAKPIILWGN